MRKITRGFKYFGAMAALVVFMSLTNPDLPLIPFDYVNLNLPVHFTAVVAPFFVSVTDFDNTPPTNQLTNDGATLGRVLFYDKNLSLNNTISCGSCHLQEFAFSDTAVKSVGFNGGHTRRSSMTIVNSRWAWSGKMFWDERAASLEAQVLMPFQDVVEMGLTLPLLEQRVRQEPYYPQLFMNAFGDTAVTTTRISNALAQFVRSIVSHSSKYDVGRAQVSSPTVPFPNFSTWENQGKALFFDPSKHCSGCHKTEGFIMTPAGPQCNGIDLVSTTDLGVYESTSNTNHIGRFRVPTLRNIELTAPYMHDGRFATLESVVEHYNTGIQLHMNLAPSLIDTVAGQPVALQMNFSGAESLSLVAFLKTLTDTSLVSEVKWSDPFTLNTSVANMESEKFSINLSPNPSNKYISVTVSEGMKNRILMIEILSSLGQKLYSKKEFFTSSTQIDISNLSEGLYFLSIKAGDQTFARRFVKR